MTAAGLPEPYLTAMKELLGAEFRQYLQSCKERPQQGIRVNTSKIDPARFSDVCPSYREQVPWTDNGFYCPEEAHPARHPWYAAGLYYIQEPSAMLPAALLEVKPGEAVLDLCAAPGGKATELGSRLKGEGVLVANDLSASRAKALLKNLELHGIGNALVCSEEPRKLLAAYGAYFDKILVDAPCSGEGMFRRDASVRTAYEKRGPQYYAPLQKEIAGTAADLLKPGGRMVYSTCTFSPLEDEQVIAQLLKEHPELQPEETPLLQNMPGACRTEKGCVRLYPHRVRGEGHFAAVLRKREDAAAAAAGKEEETLRKPSEKEEKLWREFASASLRENCRIWPSASLDGRLYMVDRAHLRRRIRYLRTGLYLGDGTRHALEPSQALAMCLRREDAVGALSLPAEDERVLRYLKGETLQVSEAEERLLAPWTLFCTDGYPLGWTRWAGGTLRNKYYPGWRWT